MGLLEVVGITAIFPFLEVVSNPRETMNHPLMGPWFEFLGLQSIKSVVIGTGLFVFFFLALSNLFSAFMGWWQQKLAYRIAHDLSIRLLEVYLSKPYRFFLENNSSNFQVKLLNEVNKFVTGVLLPLIDLCAKSFLILVIIILLIAVDPLLALTAALVVSSLYAIIYLLLRQRLKQLGEKRLFANYKRFRTLKEMFMGIKTHRIYQVESHFYQRFEEHSLTLSKIQPQLHLFTKTPRLFIELVIFGGIILMTCVLYFRTDGINAVLPTLGIYALAGVRLLPALQKAYLALSQLRHNQAALDAVYEDLYPPVSFQLTDVSSISALDFQHEVQLDNLQFRYRPEEDIILNDISLSVPKGTTVAFVGSTGSGKTTLVDLIVGLLNPTQGEIRIDGEVLKRENVQSWRKLLAYVPQEVMLFDDSVAANIALGQAAEDYDWDRIRRSAELAQIHSFIETELPKGYQTNVGERGTRLSGGEKQRVGLARALYRNPAILVLDEATSALDNLTETLVMEAVEKEFQALTIIIIAHRLSTVKNADSIVLLDKGKIIAQGKYDELLAQSEVFQEMAALR